MGAWPGGRVCPVQAVGPSVLPVLGLSLRTGRPPGVPATWLGERARLPLALGQVLGLCHRSEALL